MKKRFINRTITGLLLLFCILLVTPSCASMNQSKIDTQRKGLMIQDKAEYSRNKGKFKGTKPYKKQKKRSKMYKKNKMYR